MFLFYFTETTPEEEPSKEAEGDSSSDTGDEDIPTVITKKERASFKAVPEIIQDKGVSGSAATSDTAPSVESTLKKPLKSALKKPKNPVPPPVVLDDEDGENTPVRYGLFSFILCWELDVFAVEFLSWLREPSSVAVTDPGEGLGGSGLSPPSYFWTKLRPVGPKFFFFWDPSPTPPISGSDDLFCVVFVG